MKRTGLARAALTLCALALAACATDQPVRVGPDAEPSGYTPDILPVGQDWTLDTAGTARAGDGSGAVCPARLRRFVRTDAELMDMGGYRDAICNYAFDDLAVPARITTYVYNPRGEAFRNEFGGAVEAIELMMPVALDEAETEACMLTTELTVAKAISEAGGGNLAEPLAGCAVFAITDPEQPGTTILQLARIDGTAIKVRASGNTDTRELPVALRNAALDWLELQALELARRE